MRCALGLLVIVALLFPSFILAKCPAEGPHVALADALVKESSKLFAKREKLMLNGIGGAMMNDVESISQSYVAPGTLNIEESRVLLVKCVEGFLIRVNSDQKIRPYLHVYPFTSDTLELSLGFPEVSNSKALGKVIHAFLLGDRGVFYVGWDPLTGQRSDLHHETYAEAKRIVQESGKYAPITE